MSEIHINAVKSQAINYKFIITLFSTMLLAACGGGGGGGGNTAGPVNLTGTVSTLAGDGTFGYQDGAGATAKFNTTRGIAASGSYVYVATYNNRIRRINISSGVVDTLSGSGAAGNLDGAAASAEFNLPKGLTTDGTYIYVADSGNHRIRKVNLSTGAVSTLAGSTQGNIDSTDPLTAKFDSPDDVATDGSYVYVVDANNAKIRRISLSTGAVDTLVSSLTAQGITLSSDGSAMYVTGNNQIYAIDVVTGNYVGYIAGISTAGYIDATGKNAKFSTPNGVTTDGTNIYVADSGNNVIRKVVISTGEVTTLAGSKSDITILQTPEDLVYHNGALFVADTFNYQVDRID